MNAERNLLFGILAFQNSFIDKRALVAAFNQWVARKTEPLGAILVDDGFLDASRRELLDALVAEHLKQHGGDAAMSLAAVSSLGSVRSDLQELGDPEIGATLAHIPAGLDDLNRKATVS